MQTLNLDSSLTLKFLIWDNKLPSPEIERRLLELGACIIVKSKVWQSHFDGIEVRRESLSPTADGHARTRTVYRTPAGEVSEFYLPHIERACRTLHAAGKYVGAHLDGNNRLIVNEVAGTALDFIESFTPPPDCDMPLADARHVWPGKTLRVNLASSLHLQGPAAIRMHARRLLEEGAGDGRHFMVGVIEDVPDRGMQTLVSLAEEVATWKP